jgi:hypothetical protein
VVPCSLLLMVCTLRQTDAVTPWKTLLFGIGGHHLYSFYFGYLRPWTCRQQADAMIRFQTYMEAPPRRAAGCHPKRWSKEWGSIMNGNDKVPIVVRLLDTDFPIAGAQ